MVNGYLDMKGQHIPVLPTQVILTDRQDGTLWLLSHSLDGLYIAINTEWNPRVPYKVYPAHQEPRLPENYLLRMVVVNGYLGYEVAPFPKGISDQDQQRILTRRGLENVIREIVQPIELEPWREEGDMLAWRELV